MQQSMPDILIYKNVYARQFDEVAQTGSVEELNTLAKYAKDSLLRVMAPWMLEIEQNAKEKIKERENKEKEAMQQVMNIFMAGSSSQVINGDAHDTENNY